MATARKSISIYFTNRSESAIREGDSVSGRVGQIIDRYLELIRLDGPELRTMFTSAEWRTLLDVARDLAEGEHGTAAVAVEAAMARSLSGHTKLLEKVSGLTHASQFVLLEILEAEVPEARVGGKGGRSKAQGGAS